MYLLFTYYRGIYYLIISYFCFLFLFFLLGRGGGVEGLGVRGWVVGYLLYNPGVFVLVLSVTLSLFRSPI